MIDIQEKQDLNAWPSDCLEREKFNVVEFYHKILWASQQQYQHCEDQNKINRKRVTFSEDPPEIYEYEPEYTKTTTSFFSEYFKRKSHNLENEQYPTRKIQQQPSVPLDEECFKDITIVRVRSITDFNPVPNQQYKQQQQQVPPYHESMHAFDSSFMHTDMSFEMEQQEEMYALSSSSPAVIDESIISSPPPSYNEECIIKRKKSLTSGLKRRISMNFWSSNSNNTGGNSSSSSYSNTAEKKGLIRTLRKIKSSPRLMIQRRASVVSLHKKASFSGA